MFYDGLKEAHERAQSKSKVEGSKKIIKSERKRIEAYTTPAIEDVRVRLANKYNKETADFLVNLAKLEINLPKSITQEEKERFVSFTASVNAGLWTKCYEFIAIMGPNCGSLCAPTNISILSSPNLLTSS